MDVREEERPCIHVSLLPGTDAALYRWVQIGAEEEGVPCRRVGASGEDPVAAAYTAAESSRFSIGVSISTDMAVLHERHMPTEKPVMALGFEGQPDAICRLVGTNAARLVIRKPFRFVGDEEAQVRRLEEARPAGQRTASMLATPAAPAAPLPVDAALVAHIAARVLLKLQERGIQ